MATARRGRRRPARGIHNLPTPEQTVAEIQSVARRLGLLIDLHRVASQLRAVDARPSQPTT
jgi:hypothetical protein